MLMHTSYTSPSDSRHWENQSLCLQSQCSVILKSFLVFFFASIFSPTNYLCPLPVSSMSKPGLGFPIVVMGEWKWSPLCASTHWSQEAHNEVTISILEDQLDAALSFEIDSRFYYFKLSADFVFLLDWYCDLHTSSINATDPNLILLLCCPQSPRANAIYGKRILTMRSNRH